MEKQNIKQQIENYKIELKTEIHHPILQRDLGDVKINDATVFFLLLPLLNGESWSESVHAAAIAVGAVHAAFEAHDVIDKSNATSPNQQLTVLSGDYFSGIHYRLLASLSDFNFIGSLSRAIGTINEIKTNFHLQSPDGPIELIDTIRTIESTCAVHFFRAFGYSKYVPLVSSALPLIILDIIEQNSKQRANHIAFDWNLHVNDVSEAITKLRTEMLQALDEATFLLPFLKEEIDCMTMPLLGKMI